MTENLCRNILQILFLPLKNLFIFSEEAYGKIVITGNAKERQGFT